MPINLKKQFEEGKKKNESVKQSNQSGHIQSRLKGSMTNVSLVVPRLIRITPSLKIEITLYSLYCVIYHPMSFTFGATGRMQRILSCSVSGFRENWVRVKQSLLFFFFFFILPILIKSITSTLKEQLLLAGTFSLCKALLANWKRLTIYYVSPHDSQVHHSSNSRAERGDVRLS